MGDIYRIKRRYEKPGPPFIRVFTVHARRHLLRVVDYMENGQLARECCWGADGFGTKSKLPRWFEDESGWRKLAKYWRLVRPRGSR